MRKKFIRFFTIADYYDEEKWLRDQHKKGWKMVKMTPPCFYIFESCEPQDIIYRLDYKNFEQTEDYMQMVEDFGWEYFEECYGWLYFRKPAENIKTEEEGELFSDDASKADMVSHVMRTRFLPFCIMFFLGMLPNIKYPIQEIDRGGAGVFLGTLFGILFLAYVWLLVHCGIKLKSIKQGYEK